MVLACPTPSRKHSTNQPAPEPSTLGRGRVNFVQDAVAAAS